MAGERQATATLQLIADISAAEATYSKFFSRVESTPLRIPFSGAVGGGPISTLSGATVASSPSIPFSTGASSPNISFFNSQLAQQIGQAVSQAVAQAMSRVTPVGGSGVPLSSDGTTDAAPDSAPSGAFASRAVGGIGRRLARAGGAGIALYGARALEAAYVRNRELDELSNRDPVAASQLALSQAESDRNNLFSSKLRNAFANSGFGNIARDLGFTVETDGDRVAMARRSVASNTAGELILQANRGERKLRRDGDLIGISGLRAERMSAQNDFATGNDLLDQQRVKARATSNDDPEGAATAYRAIDQQAKALAANLAKTNAVISRLSSQDYENLGYEAETIRMEGQDKPLAAARSALRASQKIAMDKARISDSQENIIGLSQKQMDARDALSQDQNRTVSRGLRDTISEGESASLRLSRNPLGARLNDISRTYRDRLDDLGQDREREPQRQHLRENQATDELLSRQEDSDRRELVGLQLSGRGTQLRALLSHNPVGAEVSGIVTGGLAESLNLRNSGLGSFQSESLQNSVGALNLTRQNFLEGFHATQIGQNFETGSPRQQQDVTKILTDIQGGIDKLTSALRDVAAAK